MRSRGSVPRIQIKRNTIPSSYVRNHTYDGIHVRMDSGDVHPPRNSVMPRPLMANIPRYSPRKNSANLKPEYSLW